MRAFLLVSFVILVLGLAVLEVVASRLTSEQVGRGGVWSVSRW